MTGPKEILNNIKVFYETLIKQNSAKTNVEKQEFLNSLDTKTLTNQINNQTYAKMKYEKLIYSI